MASSNAAWVLGGVRLISSASTMLPKIGPWTNVHLPMAGGEILFDDVGAGDVGGHQVRRELDAPETQAERLRDGAHHQRLGRAGQAGDQAMATDKQRGEDLIEHLLLADDHLAHLGEDAFADRWNRSMRCLQFGRVQVKFSDCYHRHFPFSTSSSWCVLLFRVFLISSSNFCAGRYRARPPATASTSPPPCPSGRPRSTPAPD